MRTSTLVIGVGIAAVSCAACGTRPPLPWQGDTGNGGSGAGGQGAAPAPTRDVDLLFVVDNSSAMAPEQEKLIAAFSHMAAAFEALPSGLPNLHLAVINTDLGAGDGSIQACWRPGGDGGAFQRAARLPCTDTPLEPTDTFLTVDAGIPNTRLPLAEAFACIARLGDTGCLLERPLAAIARALGADGRPPPPENEGFLRPNAVLAIVVLSSEDDCSAASEALFDVNERTLDSPLGPVASYRCNEFGHLCGNPPRPPPRLAPNGSLDDRVELTDCVSAEEQGMLIPVSELARQVKGLKAFPDRQILVAAITGPTTPYVVEWGRPNRVDTGPWPVMSPSCTDDDGEFADPAVRTHQWTRAFGENGLTFRICDPTYDLALLTVVSRLGSMIVP